VHAAALAWARHTGHTMSGWVVARGDATLQSAWQALQAAAWAPGAVAEGTTGAFVAALGPARVAWRREAQAAANRSKLPPLNPDRARVGA